MESPNGKAVKLSAKEASKFIQKLLTDRAMKLKGKAKQRSFPDDAEFAKDYPLLWAYLGATQIGEAMEKDSARLVCGIEESTWQATLQDSALKQSLTAAGLTHRAALAALEEALGGKDATWVYWKKKGQEALREKKKDDQVLDNAAPD